MRLLDILYNILFYPSHEFKVVSMGPVPKDYFLGLGTIIVVLVSSIGVLYSPFVYSTEGLFFTMILAAISGLVFWLFTVSVFSTAAYIFGGRGRPQTLLILTAFATLPWIFLPVVMLFKSALGTFGHTISIFASLGLWIWTAILFLMAIKYTYNLSLERLLLAASLPLLMAFLGITWAGGFFFNLFKFLS